MNYIRHLNAFFSLVHSDNRLTSSHVSLYMALFQYWNFNRFENPFPVYRNDIMKLCKIGSKNTYHKCIRELHQAKYIFHHPATHKYQPVKISLIRLDKHDHKNPDQLNLLGIKSGTAHVSNLTDTSPKNETPPVSNPGHLIKHTNNKQERETLTHKIFKRNKKIQDAINDMAHVPESVHIPTLSEVEKFFANKAYPVTEAKKFFNHYKAIGWKIQGKTPIEDWKALVEKWMENAKKWNVDTKANLPLKRRGLEGGRDIQYLYDQFLEGKKIFNYILPEHFDQLKLELTEETMQQAWQERINQVAGTNQHSLIQIWQAYLSGDPENELVKKDNPNLIALAKRIAVIKHFHNLKNQPS